MPVSGLAAYDEANIFARILRGEIPCRKSMRMLALAFHDIHPQAPVHVLVIPKGAGFPSPTSPPGPARPKSPVSGARSGTVAKQLGLEARRLPVAAQHGRA